MEPIRVLEVLYLVISSMGLIFSIILLVSSAKDTIGVEMHGNGDSYIMARAGMRAGSLVFVAQLAFFYTAVSFVSSPVPVPLPVGTGERVSMVTIGAIALLLHAIDQYVTTRRLLKK
jgi:hypothetical protein